MTKLRVKLAASLFLLASLLAASTAAAHAQTTLEWITLAPANEGFSVNLPLKPDAETERVAMEGGAYKTRLYTAFDETDRILYMVVMQEFSAATGELKPAVRLEQFMEGFKEGLKKSIGNGTTNVELLLDRHLDLKRHLGRQFKLTFGEARGLVRAFDASLRIYVLLVMGADEKNSNAMRFFDSFEIKAAPPPVPLPPTEKQAS